MNLDGSENELVSESDKLKTPKFMYAYKNEAYCTCPISTTDLTTMKIDLTTGEIKQISKDELPIEIEEKEIDEYKDVLEKKKIEKNPSRILEVDDKVVFDFDCNVVSRYDPQELAIYDKNTKEYKEYKEMRHYDIDREHNIIYMLNKDYKVEKINLGQEQKSRLKQQLKLSESLPVIIIFGGSQGAESINKCLINLINKHLNKKYQILWAVGNKNYEQVVKNIKYQYNVTIVPYIYNMEEVLNLADLVVSRSGAMTITEVSKCGKPAIFIPFPYATENHQEYNAKVLANAGAEKIILDKELNEQILDKTINEIIQDKEKIRQMGINAEKMSIKNVEEKIYKEIERIVNKSKRKE